MDATQERVARIVAAELHVDASHVGLDASLTDDLGADSLDSVEITMALEDEFNVMIPDEEAAKLTTVREAARWLENQTGTNAGP